MTVMVMNGMLCCLMFMLTSAAMKHQSKRTANLQMYGEESRMNTQGQGRNRRCRNLDGRCYQLWKECPKSMPLMTAPGAPYCRTDRRCCYPETKVTPKDCCAVDGCFYLYASSQCFCVFNATNEAKLANFTEAASECANQGWQLAHPGCAVALRSHIVQEYGNCDHLWLNAKANGTNMIWQDNGVTITNSNPLFPIPPSFPEGNCLELHASEAAWDANPNAPYFSEDCDVKHQHILCERIY